MSYYHVTRAKTLSKALIAMEQQMKRSILLDDPDSRASIKIDSLSHAYSGAMWHVIVLWSIPKEPEEDMLGEARPKDLDR